MLNFLDYLGNKVVGRYKTMEANIRNRSNSFYDSFLDLLEETVKTILVNENVAFNRSTCGEILREKEVSKFFLEKIKLPSNTYSKILDHIKKINKHKHHNENYLSLEKVLSYMEIYYFFLLPYYKYKNVDMPSFDKEYFTKIYGVTLKKSDELDNVSQKLDDLIFATSAKLVDYEARISDLENKSTPKENHNRLNEKEALDSFLKSAKKSYRYLGNKKDFRRKKGWTILSLLLLFIMDIAASSVTTYVYKIYTTFTFLENIYFIFGVMMLTYVIIAKIKYDSGSLAKYSIHKYQQDKYGLYVPKKEKTSFKVFRIIALICPFCNIIVVWYNFSNFPSCITASVIELLFLGSVFFSYFMTTSFFKGYCLIYLEGNNLVEDKETTLVFDPLVKKFFHLEDFQKKVPHLFD